MPKKNKIVKSGAKKKRVNKPKAKPLVKYIYTEPLSRKGCCTDVLKTGQGYTIPQGFYDRLGINRLPFIKEDSKNPSVKIPTESIETQTEIPIKRSYIRSGRYRQPVKAEEIYTEYEPIPITSMKEFFNPSPFAEVQAEVKPKRKYVKSGKYSKKPQSEATVQSEGLNP